MAKDPAVLWYWNDWSGGTMTLSRFLKGCYMDLLTAQFNNGHLSLDEIKTVLGSDFGQAWPTLQKKFKLDNEQLYYNERLVFEATRRKKFSKTQTDRVNKRYQNSTNDIGSTNKENEIENVNDIDLIEESIYRKFAHLKISFSEVEKLIGAGYSQAEIDNTLDSIENYKKNTNYTNLYLTAKKWLEKDYFERIKKSKTGELINTAERVKQQFANESDN